MGSTADLLREDVREVEADGLLELVKPAGPRITVGAPPDELGRVPEPGALHVVVAHLDDPLGPQRHERQVLARVPPAGLRLARVTAAGLGPGPVPRGAEERGDQRLHLEYTLPAGRPRGARRPARARGRHASRVRVW